MSEQYRRALRACGDKMLKLTRQDDYELFCYTKDCFHGKNTWNDLTKSHRGALYHKAKMVNKPFVKIFNVNEVKGLEMWTIRERMETEEYEVMHKANGHLFIVSAFLDDTGEQHIVFHTKGGLQNPENDLLNDDVKVFVSLHGERFAKLVETFPNSTWMFEAIVAHDKHSMYEYDSERYGENAFVMLGANIKNEEGEWEELEHDVMKDLGPFIGAPVIEAFDPSELHEDPDVWYDASETEGYVIRFPSDGTRVKIKTREYWANRFLKELTPENILTKFANSGGSPDFLKSLPEEKADTIKNGLDVWYQSWWSLIHVGTGAIFADILTVNDEPLTREQRAELFAREDLTMVQKQVVAAVSDGKKPAEEIWGSKNLRKEFREYILNDAEQMKIFEDWLAVIASE